MLYTLNIVLLNPHNNPERYYTHFAEENEGRAVKLPKVVQLTSSGCGISTLASLTLEYKHITIMLYFSAL